MLYTSGSTGRPKGVVVPHRALAASCAAMADVTGPQAGRACARAHLAVVRHLRARAVPAAGGRRPGGLARRDDAAGDGAALRALIARRGVTDVQATPSGWRMLLAAGSDRRPCPPRWSAARRCR